MRHTSERRRNRRTGVIYTGAKQAATKHVTGDLTVPDDDPQGVVCPECGARVKQLVSGRPRAHAPGGFGTSTRMGRFHCAGSGTHG